MTFGLPVALALLIAAPVAAQEAPASADPAAQPKQDAPAKPKKPKKICRSETTIGSHMASQTCRTQAEWDAIEQQSVELSTTRNYTGH